MKRQGPIWLGLTEDVPSLRAHPDFGDFGRMIARSAFAQLRYSPLLLAGTLAGMALDLSGAAAPRPVRARVRRERPARSPGR